jgi:hypothetical protein
MIAAIQWIPAGVANPTPSKYEYSRAEQDFLDRFANGNGGLEDTAENAEGADDSGKGKGDVEESDEEWEDMDDDDAAAAAADGASDDEAAKIVLPKVDPSSLPADLRMDDYSDDDDDDKEIGNLLVGKVSLCGVCDASV